jgi:transcriptional regulator with XRE-family HTH domain
MKKSNRAVPLPGGGHLDLGEVPRINLDERLGLDNPESQERIATLRDELEIGLAIHDARKAAGLSMSQLARRVGTTPSVISRVERADYQGHSTTLLRRIAKALGMRLIVAFVPAEETEDGRRLLESEEPRWRDNGADEIVRPDRSLTPAQ